MTKQVASVPVLRRTETVNPDAARGSFFASLDIGDETPAQLLSAHERLDRRFYLMLDRSGKTLAIGKNTQSELSSMCCFSLRGDRLFANRADGKTQLDRLLQVHENEVEVALLACEQVGGHVLMAATGLNSQSVLLSLHVAMPGQGGKLVDLTEAFGLTPSEARIIELLLSGYCPSKISHELEISVHTVRAHLRHCYDKLGVSSREELWQTLSPYHIY